MAIDPILKALADVNPNLPLEPNDPRFVDLDQVRGFALRDRVSRLLGAEETRDGFAKIAVAGHRGSGKSTELNRVFDELEKKGYEVLLAEVNKNLDPNEISFSDVMRLIVQLIDDRFGAAIGSHPHLAEAFRVVLRWFQEVTKSHSTEIQNAKTFGLNAALGGKFGVEGGMDAGTPLAKGSLKVKSDLGELVAAVGIVRRSEGKERTEIKETLERYTGELVENVNALLRAIAVVTTPGKKVVFILDGVDKYEPAMVNDTFFRHAELIQSLECHLLFAIHSSLLYDPADEVPDQSFKTLALPMLPVYLQETRKPNEEVVPTLMEAVFLRVPRSLFVDPEISARKVVLLSGGCWRDMLRLLEEALLGADDRITSKDIERARDLVAQTFQRLLGDGEDYDILANTHRNHQLPTGSRARHLLRHRCVLGYNGKGWYDIHPLIETYPPVVKAIQNASKIQTPIQQ